MPPYLHLYVCPLTYTPPSFRQPLAENTDSQRAQNWIDFDAGWTDDAWHHVAVTWNWEDGTTKAYLDGQQKTPFWKSR